MRRKRKIRNPNIEFPNESEIQISKYKIFRVWGFGFRDCFGFCASDFGFLFLIVLLISCTSGRIERAVSKADELRGTQQYDAALRAYELIVLEYPSHPKVADVLLRIGDLDYYTLKDERLAIAAYKRIVSDWLWQPAAVQAHRRLAEIYVAKEDYTTAIEYYEQLLKYFPAFEEWDEVRHMIGVCYLKQKQYVQARIEFYRMLERDGIGPEVQVKTLYDLAETFLLEGKPEAAVPYYERLVKGFPTHDLAKQARLQLVGTYMETRDFTSASNAAMELRRLYPDDPVVKSRLRQLQEEKATAGRPGQMPWSHK